MTVRIRVVEPPGHTLYVTENVSERQRGLSEFGLSALAPPFEFYDRATAEHHWAQMVGRFTWTPPPVPIYEESVPRPVGESRIVRLTFPENNVWYLWMLPSSGPRPHCQVTRFRDNATIFPTWEEASFYAAEALKRWPEGVVVYEFVGTGVLAPGPVAPVQPAAAPNAWDVLSSGGLDL